MKLYRTPQQIVLENDHNLYFLNEQWDDLINRDNLREHLENLADTMPVAESSPWLQTQILLAPIVGQEIWASGVTYLRSRNARMEESKQAGGDTFYDKVYEAARPEIFFKASPQRTVGTNDYLLIRKDSTWDVPEPELTLFIASSGKIVGYTIGNDMSSRSIEGENPLYLPQAKSYERCAGLGPCILVPKGPIAPQTQISIQINREGAEVYSASIGIDQMKRQHQELVDYLFRECEFPKGCFLMTGTGIVPDHPFTLQPKDEVIIDIEGIGTLKNWVERKP